MGCETPMTDRFEIRLFGSFSVRDSTGRDRTPKGKKSKGLLALLAETQNMRRGRRWLEAMLWSDRSPIQASGSLRQSLSEIRTALGSDAELLCADRSDVWLNTEAFETDLDPASPLREQGRGFLEGSDIRDDGFEDWLRQARNRYENTSPAQAGSLSDTQSITIRSAVSNLGSASENVVGRILADTIARGIEQNFSAVRYMTTDLTESKTRPDIEIRCDAATDGGRAVAFFRIEDGHSGRVLFSEYLTTPGTAADLLRSDRVHGIVNAASAQVPFRLSRHIDLQRPEAAAMGFSSVARRQLTRFDETGFADANANFEKAYDADSNGVFLAWRAFVRMAQLVEAVDGDTEAWRGEVDQLTTQALSQSGDNGLVVALTALTRFMLEDDLEPAAQLANFAISLNANNLFARQTLALAHSAVGDADQAYRISSSCREAAKMDELSHLWDLYHSLVCIGAGRLDEARIVSENSVTKSGHFLAPRRQLVALCAHAGDFDGAKAHLYALEKMEDGFSLDRYLNDAEYPNLTIRTAGLLDSVKKLK